jgi:hypothetical protein
MKTQFHFKGGPRFIGIDYHKHYSVYCVIDERGNWFGEGLTATGLSVAGRISYAFDGFQSFRSGPQINSLNFALLAFETDANRQFCIANIS